jgi:hypothetical protein
MSDMIFPSLRAQKKSERQLRSGNPLKEAYSTPGAGATQRMAAWSSLSRASTHWLPAAVSSSFQNGAWVFSQSIKKAQDSSAACR